MATATTKSLTVWRYAFIFQSPSVGDAFNFETPPGQKQILSFIPKQLKYY